MKNIILMVILLLSESAWPIINRTNLKEDKEYFVISELKSIINNKNCSKDERMMLGCIFSLNVLLEVLEERTGLMSDLMPGQENIEKVVKEFGILKIVQSKKKSQEDEGEDVYTSAEKFIEFKKKLKKSDDELKTAGKKMSILSLENPNADDFTQIFKYIESHKNLRKITPEVILIAMNEYFKIVIDPHTSFRSKKVTSDAIIGKNDQYIGIGVLIKDVKEGLLVETSIEEGAANKAGIIDGDILTKIDGEVLEGKNLEDKSKLIFGKVGTRAAIHVKRNNEDEIRILVRREKIIPKIVDSKIVPLFGENIGLIRIRDFMYEDGCREVARKIKKFNSKNISNIIVDLRDNTGGNINVAVCIGGLFLGPNYVEFGILGINGNEGENNLYYTKEDKVFEGKLVVIVNEKSASSSEILAGALKDYNRALLVGKRTYGKGTVQVNTNFETKNQKLWLTVQAFYQPSGISNQLVGITPHFDVPRLIDIGWKEDLSFREEDSYLYPVKAPKVVPLVKGIPFNSLKVPRDCVEKKEPTKFFESMSESDIRKDLQLVTAGAVVTCM